MCPHRVCPDPGDDGAPHHWQTSAGAGEDASPWTRRGGAWSPSTGGSGGAGTQHICRGSDGPSGGQTGHAGERVEVRVAGPGRVVPGVHQDVGADGEA